MIPLRGLEAIIDASGVAPLVEAMLPSGARTRQLSVRTLLLGMMLAAADGRPAHLTRVHQALAGLPEGEQRRLGVLADWKGGPHRLTYRQAEYTFGLVARALGKDEPDGLPSPELQRTATTCSKPASRNSSGTPASVAVDWTDLETFSRPPPRGTSDCADPEASWGHRRNNLRHDEDELFYGYYLSDAVTVPDEQGPPVAELARRMTVSSCRHDPVPAFTPVLTAMPAAASRSATCWPTPATPTASRGTGHPRCAPPAPRSSRTCTRTTAAPGARTRARSSPTAASTARAPPARCWNSGRSPAPPPRSRPPPTTRGPPRPPATNSAASPPTTKTATTASRARPPRARSAARSGPPRCSWTGTGPRSSSPREDPQACCTQQTITVPAGVLAKTAQKHDYPSRPGAAPTPAAAGRARLRHRQGPRQQHHHRGWCRLMGLAPLTLFTVTLLVVRNQRILAAWNARQEENARRAARGLPPKTRRRRRKTLTATASAAPP